MEFNKFNHINSMITLLYFDADKSLEPIRKSIDENKPIDEETEMRNELISGILVNKAISTYSSLHSFYYCNYDDAADERVDEILNKFYLFSNELLESLHEGHSYQQTLIYFQEFTDAVNVLLPNLIK